MLGNWLFFWDWDGVAPSASSTAVSVLISTSSGGGGGGYDTVYNSAPIPDAFWEEMFRRQREDEAKEKAKTVPADAVLTAPITLPPPPDPALIVLEQLVDERIKITASVPKAPNVQSLKALFNQLRELDAAILEVKGRIRTA